MRREVLNKIQGKKMGPWQLYLFKQRLTALLPKWIPETTRALTKAQLVSVFSVQTFVCLHQIFENLFTRKTGCTKAEGMNLLMDRMQSGFFKKLVTDVCQSDSLRFAMEQENDLPPPSISLCFSNAKVRGLCISGVAKRIHFNLNLIQEMKRVPCPEQNGSGSFCPF